MNFESLVKLRKSVRKYEDKKPDKDLIIKCIEAARLSPSACNSQPWSFIVVDDENLVQKVAGYCVPPVGGMNKFAKTAPVIIVQVMEKTNISSSIGSKITDREYNHIDTGLAMGNLCLQAADLGLGTCILGYFHEKEIKDLLGIPKSKRIGLLCTVGYEKGGQQESAKARKQLKDMLFYNRYMESGDENRKCDFQGE